MLMFANENVLAKYREARQAKTSESRTSALIELGCLIETEILALEKMPASIAAKEPVRQLNELSEKQRNIIEGFSRGSFTA